MFESLPQWMSPKRNRRWVQRKFVNSSGVPSKYRKFKRKKSNKWSISIF